MHREKRLKEKAVRRAKRAKTDDGGEMFVTLNTDNDKEDHSDDNDDDEQDDI